MKASEQLLTTLLHLNNASHENEVWADRAARYLSAVLPVALFLEAIGHAPTVAIADLVNAEQLAYQRCPQYGSCFWAVCAPLRAALAEIPGFDPQRIGNQPATAIQKVGFLTMQMNFCSA